jgi:hypothetical protein
MIVGKTNAVSASSELGAEDASRLRRAYRWAVSAPVREWIRNARSGTNIAAHGLLGSVWWNLLPRKARETAVDRRLMLARSQWVFVAGINNSGTSVLTSLIETHPEVRGLPAEGQYLSRAMPHPRRFQVPRVFSERLDVFRWTEESTEAPHSLRIQFDWALHFPRRVGWLLEKSPPNALRTRWLQANFRPARFVVIVRSPYAVCEGVRRKKGFTVERAARHWAAANEILLSDLEHLEHYHFMRYEDLCAEPVAQLGHIADLLELQSPFDPSVTASIQNFNAGSLSRLSDQDIELVSSICQPIMEKIGYARPS